MEPIAIGTRIVRLEQTGEEGIIGVLRTYEIIGSRDLETYSYSPPVEVPVVRCLESYRIPVKIDRGNPISLEELPRATLRIQPKGRHFSLLGLSWSSEDFGYATSVYSKEMATAIANDIRRGLLGEQASARTIKSGGKRRVWHIFYSFHGWD